ncbi:hypothetical protein PPSIR1_37269 [Plesiocystis pacifica SIR-1]|uniref:Uncharacterized protein n=1 Tax=Plesiocystis pacifica SIR-1 TaxID=391625 RepID=A6G0L9_9BACT|nr:hypothetical protein [Plesiocystis pacifica]EDM80665.1 hypothetical protein PPSIR1_37269 [Plesiocystis pacifica SIR-1]
MAIRYETEHLQIGTGFDYPLCAGDLAAYEAQVVGLESLLSTTVDEPITVYLWEDAPSSYCGEGPQGCYSPDENAIYTTSFALDHELVHAVVYGFARPPGFFDEGSAEALRRRRLVSVQQPDPLANFELSGGEVDYGSAGLFMRWLWERFGAEAFIAILKDERPPLEAFEAVYGMSPESAEAMFFEELPYGYPPLTSCEVDPLPAVDEGRWEASVRLDCGSDDVYGGDGVRGTARTVTLTEAGDYAVSFEGVSATIRRCADEILELAPEDGDPAWGDVPPTTSTMRAGYVRALEPSNTLTLVPGRYMVYAVGAPEQSVSMAVEMLP